MACAPVGHAGKIFYIVFMHRSHYRHLRRAGYIRARDVVLRVYSLGVGQFCGKI